MSKLGCVCGHVIRDQTDNLPYKGFIVRHKHYYSEFEGMMEGVSSFLKAIQDGERHEWVAAEFTEDYVNLELDDGEIISDLWSRFLIDHSIDIYQCENCGRVHIQGKGNLFHSFKPDKQDSQGVLDVKPEE